jgi:ADP-heptose:LPS heptosyltransferase
LAPSPSGDDPSILIVLTGSLGDVARGLPLAGAIGSAWPRCRLSWVVEDRWAPLVRLSRHVDEVVVFERAAGARGAWRLILALRAARSDVALDLQRILKSGMISWQSGATRRIGFNPADAKEGNAFFNTEHITRVSASESKVRHYLAFADHLGIPVREPLDFGLDRFDAASHLPVPIQARGRPFVALVVGTSWPSKDWPRTQWRRLPGLVASGTGLDVVLVGHAAGPDSPVAPGPVMDGALAAAAVIDLRGRTSLLELAAVLRLAVVATGPDTGPGHLAAAFGTPYVGLYGPTDPRRVAPWGCEDLAVTSPAPCHRCGRRCRRPAEWCMAAITAEHVWERVRDVLARPRARDRT